jgi:hypothetical protein
MLERSPSRAATRARRRESNRRAATKHRLRERNGLAIARAPYDADVLNLLRMVTRTLGADSADDADAIGEAIYRTLRESAAAAKREGLIP